MSDASSTYLQECSYCHEKVANVFTCRDCGRKGCLQCMPEGANRPCPECVIINRLEKPEWAKMVTNADASTEERLKRERAA